MSDYIVKELMVPLSEYATVPKGSTLLDAVLALEKAQVEFDHTKYKHRAVLILGENGGVIGKLSQLDVLSALEPKDRESGEINELHQYGFSCDFIRNMHTQQRLLGSPLKDICSKAFQLFVEDFMQAPSEGEFIDQEASLEIALLQLGMGHHLSLLVTRGQGKKIVGILRLTDAFAAVFHIMKECEL